MVKHIVFSKNVTQMSVVGHIDHKNVFQENQAHAYTVDISKTFLRHLEVPQIIGIMITPQKS